MFCNKLTNSVINLSIMHASIELKYMPMACMSTNRASYKLISQSRLVGFGNVNTDVAEVLTTEVVEDVFLF